MVYPLAEYMIAVHGWRYAWLVFSICAAVFVPLLLVLPWRTIERGAVGIAHARASDQPGMTVGEAVREWPFWALTGSFALTSVGVFSLVPQSMAYLLERGFEGGHAARALAIAGFLTPLGMVGFSWLADRGGRKLAALLAYSCSVSGVGALAMVHGPADEVWLWVFVLLFGGSQGSRGPMISTLATLRYRGANVIDCDATLRKGDEMGWFEHGSTIIVFAPKGFSLCPQIREGASIRMGEPLMNWKAVEHVLTILNDPKGFGIGARHITVSTVGIVPAMRALAKRPEQFRLAISLHAPLAATRLAPSTCCAKPRAQ